MKTLMRGPMVVAALLFFASSSVPVRHIEAQTPSVSVVQSGGSVYTYPEGRYELRGDGTASSPYSWVWIPAGAQLVAAPPPPPPPPPPNVRATQRIYQYPDGRYELRGDGSVNGPYYWVWIPAGIVYQPPAPPYGYQSGLKSAEGRIDSVGFFGRSIRLDDGQEFEIPYLAAVDTPPKIGQQVTVTYYVAQNGRNIVRSLDLDSGS
jgi:hypothetical protein